ncbi:MAG: hypothetical protein II363_03245 [Clostridia bacterium]|nr:hypothetical protein [Clostridia bacterium]
MDDLNEKISRLLSSPDSLQKIQDAMAALGHMQTNEPPPAPAPAPMPSASAPIHAEPHGNNASSLPDISMLTKLAPLLSSVSQEDDDTRLLHALRPYLHNERAQRLDETMKLLRLTRLLPLLQQQGILSGITTQGGKEHGG